MIKDIQELNFPEYATLTSATVNLTDMGERTITAQVKINGDISPDFSYDWEVLFQGDKYIMPIHKPQGTKENTTINSVIDLTFYHWAIYAMKRHYFVEMTSTESGTAIADKYEASLNLTLPDFITALNSVLKYYYGTRIRAELYSGWESSDIPVMMSISYTKIWDLLTPIYENYKVRWTIETDSSGDVIIKFGFPTTQIDHIFQYGFDSGLLKVERQVQSTELFNMLLGRGTDKNLPYRYFKNTDPNNPTFVADPDWVPELKDIYFSELRDSAFRSYVQGWKRKRYNGTVTSDKASVKWAYQKGFADATNNRKFQPVEYVKDDDSIREYGEIWGAVEPPEEIYPTIQGVIITPYGRIDEIVAVEEIEAEDDEGATDVITKEIDGMSVRYTNVDKDETITLDVNGGSDFTVFPEYVGNLDFPSITYSTGERDEATLDTMVVVTGKYLVRDAYGNTSPVTGIEPGDYAGFNAKITIENNTGKDIRLRVLIGKVTFTQAPSSEASKNVFNVWIKNVWDTARKSGETDAVYAERVWRPILGDSDSNEAKLVFSDGFLGISEDYEFPIIDIPVYDATKIHDGVRSYWKLTLGKSQAEQTVTGKLLPNSMTNAKAGDHFFFTGIDVPYMYYTEAEKRLTEYKQNKLDETKDIRPTWVVSLDKIRINSLADGETQKLVEQIAIGAQLSIQDKRFITRRTDSGEIVPDNPISLYIQSLTYTYNEPSSENVALLPDIEVVLTDKYYSSTSSVSMLQGEVDAIKVQLSALTNIDKYLERYADSRYLRKDTYDAAHGIITFDKSISSSRLNTDNQKFWEISEKGNALFQSAKIKGLLQASDISSESFTSGPLGSGYRIQENGNAEFQNLTVRGTFSVFEFLVQQVRAVGGKICVSPATAKISKVSYYASEHLWRCEIESDNNTITQPFVVGDQVFCQVFNGRGVKRYWRLVVEAGTDTFALSETDCEEGSSAPEVGDDVVLLGNRTLPSRQNAIMISAYDDNSPCISYYGGIDDYSLAGKEKIREGNLAGIVDSVFGQLSGYGLYAQNVFLKGSFALQSGGDVSETFQDVWGALNDLGEEQIQQGETITQFQIDMNGLQSTVTNITNNVIPDIQSDIADIPNLYVTQSEFTQTADEINLSVQTNSLEAQRYAFGQSWASGKIVHKDPSFRSGLNGILTYPTSGSNVSVSRVAKESGSPVGNSDYNVSVTTDANAFPNYSGGFVQYAQARPNAVFLHRFIAKLEAGKTFGYIYNQIGTGSHGYWCTSNKGTGKWEEYIYAVVCGTEGTFDTLGYVYVTQKVTTTFVLAYSSVFDVTDGYAPVGAENIINSINVSTEGIRINASRLEISGATIFKDSEGNSVNIFGVGDKVISVNNGVFSVDEAGKATATDAVITGEVNAVSGTIGHLFLHDVYDPENDTGIEMEQVSLPNYKAAFWFGDRVIRTLPHAVIPNSSDTSSVQRNVMMHLQCYGSGIYDRVLYADGNSEFYGMVFMGRSNANYTGYMSDWPALISEGICTKGQFAIVPRYETAPSSPDSTTITLTSSASMLIIGGDDGTVNVKLPSSASGAFINGYTFFIRRITSGHTGLILDNTGTTSPDYTAIVDSDGTDKTSITFGTTLLVVTACSKLKRWIILQK